MNKFVSARKHRGTVHMEYAIILAFICVVGWFFLDKGSFGSSIHPIIRSTANILGMEVPNDIFKAGIFDNVITSLNETIARGKYGAVKGARLSTDGDCNSQILAGPDDNGVYTYAVFNDNDLSGKDCPFFKDVTTNEIKKTIANTLNDSLGTNIQDINNIKISSVIGTGRQGENMDVQGFSYVYTDSAGNKIVGSYTTSAMSSYTFTYNSEYSQNGNSDCKQLTSSQAAGDATLKGETSTQLFSGTDSTKESKKISQGNWFKAS